MSKAAVRRFHKLCLSTLVAVYLLILAGGVVRATGSGMGCPDWPRCFGRWVPPTSVNQLPKDYKEKYSAHRARKNEKFARYLSAVGMSATANQILSDESILQETDFNPVKTWIEYVNRLLGVLVGMLIIGLVLSSFFSRAHHPKLFWVSVATLMAVIIQGWFGSIVVSTNLTSWTITVHMFLALVIVGMIIYLLLESRGNEGTTITHVSSWLIVAALVVLMGQVFLGTELRETIDVLASQLAPRSTWISAAGNDFLIHRSFSWAVLIVNGLLAWKLVKSRAPKILGHGLIILILGTFLTGVAMGYFDVPAYLQPLHLMLATGAFGVQLAVLLLANKKPGVALSS
ncbi:MAG: heme A synthase [Cyclobacteriaceae bacterium]